VSVLLRLCWPLSEVANVTRHERLRRRKLMALRNI
jgi:hypothetical protein